MPRESSLTDELRMLLHSRRTAALGTVGDDGAPFVSMTPFAVEPSLGCLVIHVSDLAAHTRYLRDRPKVSVLVMQQELPGEPVHALPRATLAGDADVLESHSPEWGPCRAAYLARFPEAEPMTQLSDFRFVAIHVHRARQISGFAAARDVGEEEVHHALRPEA